MSEKSGESDSHCSFERKTPEEENCKKSKVSRKNL